MKTRLSLRVLVVLLVVVAAGYTLVGCNVAQDEAATEGGEATLCPACGATAGSAECAGACAPQAPSCPGCRAAGGPCRACAAH